MSRKRLASGLSIAGLRVRSIVVLNVSAVTAWLEGGAKRKPLRIVKVYVLP